MRISHGHGMIFLANPKCASNTVERYLNAHMSDVVSPPEMIRHAGPVELDEYLAEHRLDLDRYVVFTTIRNPWDRLVSLYSYALRRPDSVWHSSAVSSASFSDFIRTEIVAVEFRTKFGLHGFTHLPDGTPIVDVTIPIETLATELPTMFRRYAVRFVEIDVRVNTSIRRGYREYYDAADRKLVEDLFGEDIEFGEYRF